jgi:hypothetical protein
MLAPSTATGRLTRRAPLGFRRSAGHRLARAVKMALTRIGVGFFFPRHEQRGFIFILGVVGMHQSSLVIPGRIAPAMSYIRPEFLPAD